MPRNRPQLSITLPRNFTFHYTEGEEPKTPEQEVPSTIIPPHAYRVKRRTRPAIQTDSQPIVHATHQLHDVPVPTIETPAILEPEPTRPALNQRVTEPADGFLAPTSTRLFMTSPQPRTPTRQPIQLYNGWRIPIQHDLGESISRPMSACSITSDSSDESNGSLTSHPSMGGSCTSPESDAADPFILPVKKQGKSSSTRSPPNLEAKPITRHLRQPPVPWTADMDKHLWSTYLVYLQDPTVTPFKTLPGAAPPLGVCHRVARQARRTWRGQGTNSRKVSETPSTSTVTNSPDTIKADRSGSNTPTRPLTPRVHVWPHSNSATRRKLRLLAKQKPTVAPHYQRLLRSPSPFSSGSRSQPGFMRALSPLSQDVQHTPFNTRDIQLSLTTSTATSMQPNGPLAQFANENPTPSVGDAWFNEPPVPWASPIMPSSDLGFETETYRPGAELPRLGSPFGHHTWGPSRSRQHVRPATLRTQSSYTASTIGHTLRSPVRLNERPPYPSIHKRRALHQLEEELSPGGSDMQKNLLEELFRGPSESRHRRVRSRGFSLGDVNSNGGRLETLTNQDPEAPTDAAELSDPPLPHSGESIRRLGSPFSGTAGGSMPSRRPSRHLASASLSNYDSSSFASIDQRIRQGDLSEEFLRSLRG